MKNAILPLRGLVLAGGKSSRMLTDKGLLNYHGMPQREYAYRLLENVCNEVFLSVARPIPEGSIQLKTIADIEPDLGPIGALLSAFSHSPDSAWMALACDMPLVTKTDVAFLAKSRNPKKFATVFEGAKGFPEPLFSIWEPKAMEVLQQSKENGMRSPRKILSEIDIELIKPKSNINFLANVNTPEEYNKLKIGLKGSEQ